MDNSEDEEVKGINENHILNNKIKSDEIKRKLSDIYIFHENPNKESNKNSKLVNNDELNEDESVKENNAYDSLLRENDDLLEIEKNILEKKEINEEPQMNELCTFEPNRKKKKKRKKKHNDNIEMAKPTKQMVRINYLLQASFLMNKFSPNISREYIKTMRRFSNKFLIKYDKKFKKLFCKKCNSVLIPSVTCKISVDPLNLQKKKISKNEYIKDSTSKNNNFNIKSKDEYLVSYKCNYCQHNTKFVYENNLTIPQEKESLQDSVHII